MNEHRDKVVQAEVCAEMVRQKGKLSLDLWLMLRDIVSDPARLRCLMSQPSCTSLALDPV